MCSRNNMKLVYYTHKLSHHAPPTRVLVDPETVNPDTITTRYIALLITRCCRIYIAGDGEGRHECTAIGAGWRLCGEECMKLTKQTKINIALIWTAHTRDKPDNDTIIL